MASERGGSSAQINYEDVSPRCLIVAIFPLVDCMQGKSCLTCRGADTKASYALPSICRKFISQSGLDGFLAVRLTCPS